MGSNVNTKIGAKYLMFQTWELEYVGSIVRDSIEDIYYSTVDELERK